jgi:predicted ester cyclase
MFKRMQNPTVFAVFIFSAYLLITSGCTAHKSAMNRQKLTEFGMRYTEAWCSQNAASVASFYAENGSLQINDGEPSVGGAAITEAAQGFMKAFPDMVVEMDSLVMISDHNAEYHWTLTGTNTGPGGTGKALRISGYEEWTFGSDGLIAESKGHFDAGDYQRQLEHGPPE